ncbi:hypothetical protein RUND412_008237 [Rhizina undulata]
MVEALRMSEKLDTAKLMSNCSDERPSRSLRRNQTFRASNSKSPLLAKTANANTARFINTRKLIFPGNCGTFTHILANTRSNAGHYDAYWLLREYQNPKLPFRRYPMKNNHASGRSVNLALYINRMSSIREALGRFNVLGYDFDAYNQQQLGSHSGHLPQPNSM